MSRRTRRFAVRSLLPAVIASAALLAAPGLASADVTTDMNNWNLNGTASPYGSNFTVSGTTSNPIQFRWLDSTPLQTKVYATSCSSGTLVGVERFYAAGDTGYQTLHTASAGYCFRLWGVAYGGTMTVYDGRVSR